jgi:hypothetical protein
LTDNIALVLSKYTELEIVSQDSISEIKKAGFIQIASYAAFNTLSDGNNQRKEEESSRQKLNFQKR